jgi:hypothetical protein
MEIKLLELKRYAIDNRVEIRFSDSGHQFAISDKGLAKVLSEDKAARVEDVLSSAQGFDVIRQGKPARMSRDDMARTISEAHKGRGAVAADKDED